MLVVCSGLGYAQRGFEAFAQEAFSALRRHPSLRMTLVRARGARGEGELLAPALPRASRAARALGGALRRDGYFVEQVTYALSVLPLLARERPDVVYFSDWVLGGALGRWRALTRSRFRLLLSNGAPGPPPYDWTVDHVQQLTPRYHELALGAGEPPSRHTLLPLGVAVEPELRPPSRDEREALRERLRLPRLAEIVLSVAALNVWSKRLDYVIREVAAMEPRPHLLLLGQPEQETPKLLRLATSLLGPSGFTARTVPPAQVADHYRAADAFVLGSIHEGMARVLVESLGHGLPTVSHDGEPMRFVTGPYGLRADLSEHGALTDLLAKLRRDGLPAERRRAQHRFAYETFAWERLVPRYVSMIEACAAAPPRWRRAP